MTGWQAVAQAADAGLVLTHTLPFVAEQGYAPSDYKPERPGDGFRVEGARWHVCCVDLDCLSRRPSTEMQVCLGFVFY